MTDHPAVEEILTLATESVGGWGWIFPGDITKHPRWAEFVKEVGDYLNPKEAIDD